MPQAPRTLANLAKLLALCVAFAPTINCFAAAGPRTGALYGHTLSYGVYSARVLEKVPTKSAHGTYDVLDQLELLDETTEIPCTLGTRFGVTFEIRSVGERPATVPIEVVWRHPKLALPNGGWIDQQRDSYDETDPTFYHFSWEFEKEYERVGGEWTVSVFSSGERLIHQKFNVKCESTERAE